MPLSVLGCIQLGFHVVHLVWCGSSCVYESASRAVVPGQLGHRFCSCLRSRCLESCLWRDSCRTCRNPNLLRRCCHCTSCILALLVLLAVSFLVAFPGRPAVLCGVQEVGCAVFVSPVQPVPVCFPPPVLPVCLLHLRRRSCVVHLLVPGFGLSGREEGRVFVHVCGVWAGMGCVGCILFVSV